MEQSKTGLTLHMTATFVFSIVTAIHLLLLQMNFCTAAMSHSHVMSQSCVHVILKAAKPNRVVCLRSCRSITSWPVDASSLPVQILHVASLIGLLLYRDSLCNHSPVVYLHPSSGPITTQAEETFCWNHPFLWILGHRKIDRHWMWKLCDWINSLNL